MLVVCENCKQKFNIDGNEVVHKKKYKIDEQSIFLTYYDCPSCGRRHYVQIDDDSSLEKLRKVKGQFVKLAIARRKGKKVSEKRLAEFKEARQDLSFYRIELMKKYTNRVVHDDEISDFLLRFSV